MLKILQPLPNRSRPHLIHDASISTMPIDIDKLPQLRKIHQKVSHGIRIHSTILKMHPVSRKRVLPSFVRNHVYQNIVRSQHL